MIRVERLDLLTASDGSFTGYFPVVSGLLQSLVYVPDGTSPLDTGGDFVITDDFTGKPIVTITNIGTSLRSINPREATHAVADASAAVYATDGPGVLVPIAVAGRIKVVIASGGATKSGKLYAYVLT